MEVQVLLSAPSTDFSILGEVCFFMYARHGRSLTVTWKRWKDLFKFLIYAKKVGHLKKDMLRKIRNIGIPVVARISKRYGYNFRILSSVINHREYSNGVIPYKCYRDDRFRAKYQYIERVIVIPICAGNKPIVCWVMG